MHNSRLPSKIDKIIGECLYELRCDYELTQAQMANFLGISAQQYQKYEKGKNRLAASKLYELSVHLNFDASDIYQQIKSKNTNARPV